MNDVFSPLKKSGASVPREILGGITTFLTMSYILLLNPHILAETGMPEAGALVATALSAAVCTLIMGLCAGVPFAMAPGMGVNTFFAYTLCAGLNFHWKEALAVSFAAGLLHVLIMATGLRKRLINAIPYHLKIAVSVGLGLFIAYLGIKNAGFLSFSIPMGQYATSGGAVIGNSATIPIFAREVAAPQLLALISFSIMITLFTLEKKTGESYAALPVAIVAATFIGIPLHITDASRAQVIDFAVAGEIREVFLSFFGRPGLLSLFDDPARLLSAGLAVLLMPLTDVMGSIGTLFGIGRLREAEIFSQEEMEDFSQARRISKLDRALICNSLGGGVSVLLGATPCTTYIESVTGVVAGGRTGLSALVTGLLFVLCLPLVNFFHMVPAAASAPALIVAGIFVVPLAGRIDWRDFEECFPAAVTILLIPISFSVMDGIVAGILTHIAIQGALGKWRGVHPVLYAVAAVFLLATMGLAQAGR